VKLTSPAAALAILSVITLAGCAPGTAAPTPSPTESSTQAPSISPTPTPEAIDPTCDNIATPEYHAMAAANEWVSWTTPRNGIGSNPFDVFPGGAPAGSISCRWGSDPDVATDNILDMAWGRIDSTEAADAQVALEELGFQRIDAPEGVYLVTPNQEFMADEEGYGASYLFTPEDVRYAMSKAELAYVQAPEESE